MGETDGDVAPADERASQEPSPAPGQDTLQVPTQKKRRLKSPTPLGLRGRSATPIRGRSQTPFTLYLTRRSATPSTWRSITPFLKREDKEKTPFELGRDIKTQLYCNKAVFDKALIMDITEPEVPPVRYITSDMSVIDRAAVMDVSNVEVIYVVEEYDEYTEEEEEEVIVEVKPKKKEKKGKKGRTPRRSTDKEESPRGDSESRGESEGPENGDREESVEPEGGEKKSKKKTVTKKKEKKEKSPSPKLSLKLELGGGPKASKKMFDNAPPQPPPQAARPPPKKSKIALQMEEQAKAAKAAAEEQAKRDAEKQKNETFEERQKRLKAEAEEQARIEAELRAQQEAEEAELAAMEHEEEASGDEEGSEAGHTGYETGDGDTHDEDEYGEDDDAEAAEEDDEFEEHTKDERRASKASVDSFTRPDPEDEERWKKIAEEEGEEFMLQLRKYSRAQARSERERDADWQKRREQARLPHFINFLTDRTVEASHNVRLACAVGGPELSVKWFKDGKQLERDATHRIANNNNILTLEVVNTVPTDSGEYSCVIANANDEVTSSCIVTIYEVFKGEPSPPTFSLIRDFYHLHDDELTIECHVHGMPRPKITWWFGAFELKASYKFTLLEEAHGVYKLLIYRPSNKDSGKYICKAINSSGEAQISHAIEVAKNKNFHVHGIFHARDRFSRERNSIARQAMEEAIASKKESDRKRAGTVEPREPRTSSANEPIVSPKNKLKIATQLRDRMALEGATIKLFCNVMGPDPQCRWMKDDKFIAVGPNVRNLTEEGRAVLELIKVTSEASGQYKLVAKNEHSQVDTSCYLKVYSTQVEGDEQEPMFALPIRDVYHSSENDLIIDTKVRGNPRPTISWFKDSQPVVVDDRIQQIEHLDGICELIINKPTPRDSGEYACEATNSLGNSKITHSVVVDQLPASRRSSALSSNMGEDSAAGGKQREGGGGDTSRRPPKGKKNATDEGEATYERRSRMPDPSPKMALYFIGNISNRYLAEGNRVKLQAVIGGPDPTIKWLKDGQNVVYGPRIRNLSRDGLAVLEFTKTEVGDSGTYTVIARNESCEINSTALLHVYQPKVNSDIEPVFIRSLKETYHLNTNELILETGARGQPTPTISWFKDSVEITNGDRFQIINHAEGTSELIIDSPTDKDSGKYVVKAENRAGKSEIAHHVLFEGKETHIAENIHGVFHADKNLLRKGHKEEERAPSSAATDSEAEGEEGKGKGKKGKKGKKKEEEEEVIEVPDVPVKEQKREKHIGIHFKAKATDRVVAEGSRVKLTAYLEGNEPQVKWFRNDEPIAFGPKVRHSYREGLCTLELVSANVNDSGEYKCVARDGTGEVSTACKLEVYARPDNADVPPTFTRSIKDAYHGKVNEIVLDVHVRGLPTPTITWVKDGVKIEPSDKYQQIDHPDGTCELFISTPVPGDSGKYVCQAENRKDKAEITHLVHIEIQRKRAVSPGREIPKLPPSVASAEESAEEKEKKKKKKKDDEEEESSSRREVPPPPDLRKRVYLRNYLSNRTVPSGSNVRWMVNIDGPDATARWYRNEQPIAFGPKSKLALQDGIAYLQLVGVTEEEAGEIKLVVKGAENEVQSTCTLFVYNTAKVEEAAPVFTVGIKDTYQSQFNQIVLECKVSGNPKPSIFWQKDNLLLEFPSDKYRLVELPEGIKQLIITGPSEEDTGLYTCYAESLGGQMKLSKFLDVTDHVKQKREQKQPQDVDGEMVVDLREEKEKAVKTREAKRKLVVEATMKSMTLGSGNKAQLLCNVSGPIDEVQWYKNGQRVFKDSKHKIYNINGTLSLEIYDASPDDSGEYTCIARNAQHQTENKSILSIYDSRSELKPPESFASAIRESFDAHRNELVLECNVHGRPRVTWLKDDHLISNNRYRQIEEIGGLRRLVIRNPISSDFGSFACYAEADDRIEAISVILRATDLKKIMTVTNGHAADSRSDESYKHHRSSTRDHEEEYSRGRSTAKDGSYSSELRRKPVFSMLLNDRTVSECSNLRLTCNIVGESEIAWLKDHNPLPANSRYQKYFSNGTATLEIFSAQVEDSGSYTCRAYNEYGETLSYAQVKVYQSYEDAPQPPTFIRYMKDTYSLNENELVLDCRVRGKPRPEIQWMKDSDMINTDEKYRTVDQADGYCKLIINSPTEKDAGLYSCIARNSVHEEKITHQVDFQGRDKFILEKTHGFFHRDPNKPHFTSPLGNQTVTPGGTIAIQAEFLPTSTPIDVQWFRDKQSLAGQPNVRTFLDHGVYTLAIQNAAQEWEGTYTCRASNAFGKIESHVNVDIAAKGGKAAGPPLFLSRPETEMKIAVGDPFSISFRLQGEPKPKLTLLKGTRDITKSDRVSKEASDDYIRFTVQKSQVADSGTYFVVARNEFGTDRVFVTITVLQRARSATPTSPRWGLPLESFPDTSYFRDPPGPISTEPTVIDAGKSHISLSWGKPQGGNSAPVIAYRVDAWIVGKEGGAMWKEIGMTPINSFDAFNLLSKCEYHFRVTPKNRYGWGPSVQTRSPVQVGGAECLPEFVKILPGQTKALLDKECSLECVVQGAPRPKIIWYKDGLQIESTERVRIKQFGSVCTLHISQVFDIDSGRYTCEATNSKGRVSTFARLQVVSDAKLYAADHKLKELVTSENGAPLGETIPIFTMRLRDRRVQVTYPVRLTCQVMGYPRPEITWYKNDEVVEHSRTTVITDDGQFNTLEITSTKLDDSGIYTCTARNELGSVSCHCSLIVDKGIRAYISPDFYMPLEPFYIFREGQEIRLTAKVEAYPSVGVSWHRNGVKLRPSRRILATLDSNGFVELIIAEATQRDAGIYVCVASNAVGKVETSTRVTVEEVTEEERKKLPAIRTGNLPYSKEPLFVVKPRSSEAYEGDTVIIFCEVIGDPKPDVVWLRDFLKPEYYKDAPHFRRIGDGPEYRLEIPSAKLDFTGTYSVIASNCHGQTQAIISLQIFAKDINKLSSMEKGSIRHGNVETLPFFISPLKDLRCCDGDAVTLECHVEAVPEPAIIWEKDGHVLHSGKDFDMIYDGVKAVLSIRRVFSEDEGEYTCVAKNSVGRALSSACIIVDVPEEKENLLTRQLARPSGLLSACSTPRSTPRTTPNRSVSPLRLSFRHTSIDLTTSRRAVAAPKFYAIPHNKVVEEGDSVRFQCAITGHPTPWSTWDKDGLIVTPTTRISVKEIEDLRMLEIDEVTFDDAGLYRITLENDYGRIEATARLDVIGSSKYSRSPAGRAVRSSSSKRNFFISRRIMGPSTRIGGRMALSTGMRGSSVPARKFYHNGDEVMASERIQIALTDSEALLIVDNVTEKDEGIYTCIAEDEHSVQATSTSVAFYTEDKDIPCDPPKIVSPLPTTVKAYEGQTTDLAFELECFEPYSYVWTRNGQVLPDSSEFKYIDHGNGIICLRIQDTFDLDTGLYECIVTSVYGTCTSTCELQVDDRHPAINTDDVDRSGLAILKHPLPVIGIEGMITSFCAKVYPLNAHSTWTVCGRDVTADSRNFSLEESHSDGVRILHVLGLDYSHSGEVQFTVRSPIRPKTDRITTYTSLAVLPGLPKAHFQLETPAIEEVSAVPAYINQGPADCTALIGETVRLRVTYGGYPVPAVKWFKAGRLITEGSNTRVCTIPGQSTLELTSITADDSGKYTVEIMNDHSSDFAAASVAVEGPPEPPSGKPSISQGPDRVAVAWCGPPYDGGCMLTGFIIEMQNESDGEWREIATVVDSLAYTVKHLTPQSAYRFRVRAENIHGRSEPGFASDRVEISDPEVSSEDFQRTISIKAGGDFKSRFEILEELGKGRFGVVYKVQEKDTSQTLAAKVIKCIKSRDRQKVQEEISIMQSLQHPKLLQLAASFESAREIVMVMEYITGGELFERVVADDFTLTERDCILFLRQVCEGVDYMHSQSIVHLDLKPENIMCHTRTSHQIKIIDFGLAQRLNSDSPVRVLFGTPEFIPPEIINYEPISFQSDMWSVGVICYVLLSGLSPFMGDSDADTFNNITRADYDFEDEAFDAVSQEAKDFISNLLVHRKEDRLTAKQCLESTWLTQQHDENLSNNKICTDKLKKFIIRRKWQKTGNAIRALGRMANLSASRRNSAVSAAGSLPSSPRPSVSGASIFNPNISAHMTSLNEEEDDFNPDLPSLELKLNVRNSLKVRDKTQCSERSDSGFSECSTCSGGVNGQCHCHNSIVDKPPMATKDPEEEHSPLSVAVPHDILKIKLEEIAKSQLVEHDGSEPKLVEAESWDTKPYPKEEESPSPRPRSPGLEFNLEHKNVTMTTETVPIMRSDFTNTIKMRKKSLENNLTKEKVKPPKVIPETAGKVSMLKNKFSQVQPKSVSSLFECKANPKPSMDLNKPKNVFDRLTSCNKSNAASKTSASISLPSSPLPVRSTSTMRLSGRIREATERLSQPKTPQAPRKFTNTMITTTGSDITLKKSNSDHHQAKNLKTFRGLS